MTEQEKINLNAEIRGLTAANIWYYGGSLIAALLGIFLMYSSIITRLTVIEKEQQEINRRIEKIENKIGL